MKKTRLIILVLALASGCTMGQKSTKEKKASANELDSFYWLDTLNSEAVETYHNMYFYKNTFAASFPLKMDQKAYFSELYAHFEKHLDELGKIIDFGRMGSDKIRVISSTVNGKKSCKCILISLHNEYSPFDTSENILMVIRNENYTLKVICPLPK